MFGSERLLRARVVHFASLTELVFSKFLIIPFTIDELGIFCRLSIGHTLRMEVSGLKLRRGCMSLLTFCSQLDGTSSGLLDVVTLLCTLQHAAQKTHHASENDGYHAITTQLQPGNLFLDE
ncbi:hypothetical protein Trydic_g20493 [Trypoxylus dichotomus]